jgi:hypothetical protein
MAQTPRRRRKHRGTQAGSIDRRGRSARPRSRQEARARARKQMGGKRDLPPTWSSAVTRGLFGSAIFAVLLVVLFGRPVPASVILAVLMLLIYIPLGHAIDTFFYNRRQAAQRRQREARIRGD